MNDNQLSQQKVVLRVQVMVAVWAILAVISIVAAALTEKTGDSFLRGINRVYVFLGWQCAAFVVSVVSFITVRRNRSELPKSWRIAGIAPICIHAFIVLLVVGVIGFTLLTKPPPLQ